MRKARKENKSLEFRWREENILASEKCRYFDIGKRQGNGIFPIFARPETTKKDSVLSEKAKNISLGVIAAPRRRKVVILEYSLPSLGIK